MKKTIIGIIIGAVIIVTLVLGIMRTRESEEVESITDIQKREGIPVYATEVARHDVQLVRDYYGTVEATDQAVVTSRLMERIAKIYVDEGDQVREGQALVMFDTSASQAAVSQARLQFENARRDYERMNALYDEGAISKQQLDQTQTAFEIARENYQTARRSVELHAPISGTVARIELNEGDLANPGDPVVTIVGGQDYRVSFDVSQEDRPKLRTGQQVQVMLTTGDTLSGTISRISMSAGEFTRLFNAYAVLPKARNLYPGILADVKVVVEERKNVSAVPNSAIIQRDGQTIAFEIENQNSALRRQVQTGLVGEDYTEILAGLETGELVATYGHTALDDSAAVKVVDERDAAGL